MDALDELFILQLKRRAGAKRKLQAAVRLLGPRTRAANFVYLIQMQVPLLRQCARGSSPRGCG